MFDYSTKYNRGVQVCTPDDFDKIVKSKLVNDTCAEIADALEKVKRGELTRDEFNTFKSDNKKKLPIFCFHAHFANGRRKNADAIPSGLCIYDKDHVADPTTWFRDHFAMLSGSEKVELGDCHRVVLAHISPSGEGLRLVFVIPEGMSLLEAQKWMADELGDEEYDESVKDMARCSFAVPEDYILYRNDEELFKDRGEVVVPDNEEKKHVSKSKNTVNNNNESSVSDDADASEEIEVDPVNMKIFDLCMSEAGLNLEKLNQDGQRHNKLVMVLSIGICRLMPQSQLMAVIQSKMPIYSKEEDCKQLVSDFYENYTEMNRPMSSGLRSIMQRALMTAPAQDNEEPDQEKIPAIPEKLNLDKLPVGLKDSLAGVPKNVAMPVLISVLTVAAKCADQVEVKYCDGTKQHLGLMGMVIGRQASGKSVCKNVVEEWLKQFKEEDALSRKREDEWKQKKRSRKANEKAPEDPCVPIHLVPITISNAALLHRIKNSKDICLYSFAEELDTLIKTNGSGAWSAKWDIYRLAFDRGEWGQDYMGEQSESGLVNVAYNWCILGTYGALKRCFMRGNIENGLSSRMLIAEMPDASFTQMPHYRQRTVNQNDRINEAVTILRKKQGFYDTPKLRKAIDEWVEQKRVEAAKDIDYVKDTYRKRAAVIGFRCGVIHYLLTGTEKEQVSSIDFALAMADFVLAEQSRLFGEALINELLNSSLSMTKNSKNKTVFDCLGDTFTIRDLEVLKPDSGPRAVSSAIYRWRRDGLIEKVGKNTYKKVAV